MKLLFAFPCLLLMVLMTGSSTSATEDCNYDCEVIDFRLPVGLKDRYYRGYCECVNGIAQYTSCGKKVYDVKTDICTDHPPSKQ
uniref:Putative 7.8-9.7 kDa secreted peptide n=1 Tax=Psorophora albipes TaxID=869069 RepID=T1E2U0_9DIPT